MLVPHEPTDDPRIEWVTDLCRQVGRTEVYGSTFGTSLMAREYDGVVYLERVNIAESASQSARRLAARVGTWRAGSTVVDYVRRDGRSPTGGAFGRLGHERAAVVRHLSNSAVHNLISDALYRRARAVSIAPNLIICHDLLALGAGVRLKKLFGSRLIYDSHEFWPEADLISQPWEHRLTARHERRLIDHVDAVVTVSPPLASRLEALYRIEHVISCPNAAPFDPAVRVADPAPTSDDVKFLVQGRMAPRRGYEELLAAWHEVEDSNAVLYIRCPPNDHLDLLRQRHADLENQGRLVFLPAVAVDELVQAAVFADVGLIAYPAETKAHLEACPNKLSQFMQAGLAVLTNQLPYVQEVITRADCGLSFDLNDAATLVAGVNTLMRNRGRLSKMKSNARKAACEWFNWAQQSTEYALAIQRLYRAGRLC
jgi:glycosyltransferase involved in cell wall biosynthesis